MEQVLLLQALILSHQIQLENLSTIEPQQVVSLPLNNEQLVRLTFWDAPLMADIADCESGKRDRFGKPIKGSARQFNEKGEVLKNWNKNGSFDQGIMQINSIHLTEAKRLGFDVSTVEGNLGFARHLYERQGSDPWVCSGIVKGRS